MSARTFIPTAEDGRCEAPSPSKLGLDRENVVLGNGSNEIIEFIGHAFLRPGDEVVTARHAFAVYTLMAQLFGAKTVEVPDPGFIHDLDAMLASINWRTRQVFIANPNNPTGTMVGQQEIDRFMDRVPEEVLVVFDEAYYEFLDNPPDVLKFVRDGRNVVVMRTFSKIQGLAGLRIGYGLASREIADVLQKTRQPFNANGIAQAGALAGIQDEEHMRKTRELTNEGREYLAVRVFIDGSRVCPKRGEFRSRARGRWRQDLSSSSSPGSHRPGNAKLQTAGMASCFRRNDGSKQAPCRRVAALGFRGTVGAPAATETAGA